MSESSKPSRKSSRAQTGKSRSSAGEDLEKCVLLICHQMNHPLATIEREIRSLNGGGPSVDFIIAQTAYLRLLIKAMFTYSRLAFKSVKLVRTDPGEILSKAMNNVKSLILESGAKITHEELPPVAGNEILLIQLLQNLIVNAIRYRSRKRPVIHIKSLSEKNGLITFSFEDNGIGIDPRYAKEIFLPFRRVTHSMEDISGTGMGLAIARRIVQVHGGKIWVKSSPGEGAAFFFTLPRFGKKRKRRRKIG